MKNNLSLRIVINILIVISILHGWWFVALPLGIVGVWRFPYYFEIIAAGFAYDAIFGSVAGMGVYGYLGTMLTAGSLMFVMISKKVLRR